MNDLRTMAFEEAEKLNRAATVEEKGRLDLKTLHPKFFMLCVYGQMTGDCYSNRASELLSKCGKAYSGSASFYVPLLGGFGGFGDDGRSAFSALEYYICQPDADIAGIVEVIKGE